MTCRLCGELFQTQDFMVNCMDLPAKLLSDESLYRLKVCPVNPSKIVEAYIAALFDLFGTDDHSMIDQLSQNIVSHICSALGLVRSDAPTQDN